MKFLKIILIFILFNINLKSTDWRSNWRLFSNKIKYMQEVINKGADINAQNRMYGNTPLMLATSWNKLEIVKLLLELDADLNIKNHEGFTALMLAEKYNRNEVVKLIKDRMEFLEKRKAEVNSYLSNTDAQILPLAVTAIINEYSQYL